jgi:hypothetical protein
VPLALCRQLINKGITVADYKDILLLVSLFDEEDNVPGTNKTPVEHFNEWLRIEYPGSQPKFKPTEIAGVFTTRILRCNREELVKKFREIKWTEEQTAVLMVRSDDSEELWESRTYLVKPN